MVFSLKSLILRIARLQDLTPLPYLVKRGIGDVVKRGIGDVAAFVALCSGREDKQAVGYKEDEKTNRFPDSPSRRPVARCSRGLVTSVRCSLHSQKKSCHG